MAQSSSCTASLPALPSPNALCPPLQQRAVATSSAESLAKTAAGMTAALHEEEEGEEEEEEEE